ncbi:hypothetical protein L6452_02300 [Arctium lappa]|uniref:Uncharacterized protein n=1 Tax=Arctium lappa TaxID=4217 RepID=A0ACB9FJ78_ARCLA|nr:hypothetical protein L6452_02300 [Arctium lappa]
MQTSNSRDQLETQSFSLRDPLFTQTSSCASLAKRKPSFAPTTTSANLICATKRKVFHTWIFLFRMTSREALAIGTDTKPPVLFRGEYEQWKDRFLNFIERQDLGHYIRLSLEEGLMETKYREPTAGTDEQRVEILYEDLVGKDKDRANGDRLAKSYILQGIPNKIYVKIDSYKASGKEMWDQLEKMMLGSKVGNQFKLSNCLNSYEEFKGRSGETLERTYDRFVTLLNELSKNKVIKSQIDLNVKFLSIL